MQAVVNEINQKNRRTAVIIAAIVAGMVGLSYASVPLYQLLSLIHI